MKTPRASAFRAHLPRVILLSCAVALIAGCAGLLPAPEHMRSVSTPASGGAAKCLVLLLPGAGDSPEDFRKKGFLDTLDKSGLSVDVVAGDATLGYYLKGMMPDRFYYDVMRPAQSAGHYQQIWLIGMSMGGLGALLTAKEHGEDVTGVLALAPYLGRGETIGAIQDAGGLSKWKAPEPAPINGDNYDAQLWRFLKEATSGKQRAPQIYMGWGTHDRLGDTDELLAAELPIEHVYTTEGGHDWGPWNRLLEQFLAKSIIAQGCAPQR
jgi:pimeloyl-ACP methyl ester carboxylesterase